MTDPQQCGLVSQFQNTSRICWLEISLILVIAYLFVTIVSQLKIGQQQIIWLINWYQYPSQYRDGLKLLKKGWFSHFVEENFLVKYGCWSGGQYFRRALTFAYHNLFSFLKSSSKTWKKKLMKHIFFLFVIFFIAFCQIKRFNWVGSDCPYLCQVKTESSRWQIKRSRLSLPLSSYGSMWQIKRSKWASSDCSAN